MSIQYEISNQKNNSWTLGMILLSKLALKGRASVTYLSEQLVTS